LKSEIAGHEQRIRNLKEKETNLAAELAAVVAEVAKARGPLDEPLLRVYDRLLTRHRLVCVPIRAGKCAGCHLKVSSDVESAARKPDELAFCDQCGRLVYWES
jgi:predicted CXXCH cytochrome family protein